MGVKNTPEDKEAPWGRKKDGTPAKKRGRKDGWRKPVEETEPSVNHEGNTSPSVTEIQTTDGRGYAPKPLTSLAHGSTGLHPSYLTRTYGA